MIPKIPFYLLLSLGATSLMTWGAVAAKDNYQYNKKMGEYSKWREEFFRDKLGDDTYMCHSSKDLCLGSTKEKNKYYLPSPYENELWETAFKSLQTNNAKNQEQKQLTHLQDSYQLMDYCYDRVEEAIQKHKGNKNNKRDFNLSSSGKDEERCVLSVKELEK